MYVCTMHVFAACVISCLTSYSLQRIERVTCIYVCKGKCMTGHGHFWTRKESSKGLLAIRAYMHTHTHTQLRAVYSTWLKKNDCELLSLCMNACMCLYPYRSLEDLIERKNDCALLQIPCMHECVYAWMHACVYILTRPLEDLIESKNDCALSLSNTNVRRALTAWTAVIVGLGSVYVCVCVRVCAREDNISCVCVCACMRVRTNLCVYICTY